MDMISADGPAACTHKGSKRWTQVEPISPRSHPCLHAHVDRHIQSPSSSAKSSPSCPALSSPPCVLYLCARSAQSMVCRVSLHQTNLFFRRRERDGCDIALSRPKISGTSSELAEVGAEIG